MRDLVKLIDEMKANIPSEESEIGNKLEKIKQDQIKWTAPENMIRWEQVTYVLKEYMSKPTKEWEYKVLSIWSNMTVEEVKKEFK